MKRKLFGVSVFFALMIAAGAVAFSGLVMLLWNYTLVPVFHIGAISLWQAAGILLLSRILLGGRKRFHRHRECNRHRAYAHCTVHRI